MIPYVLRTPHRLVDLVAEDNAIEDTIYHLHRALNAGRIDLDRFLRVRPSPMPSRARWLLTAALEFIFFSFFLRAPWAKTTQTARVLAEEQFMKRALIERIQTSLPMGASVHPGWS